jgi:small-conductance mechanosensitive channel
MEHFTRLLRTVWDSLQTVAFTMGNATVTIWNLIYIVTASILLVYISSKIRYWLVHKVLAMRTTDIGVRQAIGSITRYVVITLGFIIIIQTTGIDLSALTILAGALGVGVGFGLQNITNNFVSGLVILFERPVKVGDRIQVGDITGDVVRISPRATTVTTNDNISIIIPNSEFITGRVINWSLADRNVRLNVPVGVSYQSDPERVRQILLEVATHHPGVIKHPPPDVIFNEFGDSSLNFVLRVWTHEFITRPNVLRSDLNFLIRKAFKEHSVEIPFPQRDLHIRSGPIEVKTTRENS